jgi:hypothetical protein
MAKPVELKFKAVIDQDSIDRMVGALEEMSVALQRAADEITETMRQYVEFSRV